MKLHYDDEPPTGPEDTVEKVEISLRELREARGLKIKDVTRAIKLSPSVIEAIEAEAFDQLPESVYTRTFIKNYAEALGGDYRPLLLRYDSYSQRTGHARREEVKEITDNETSSWFRAHRVHIILCVLFTVLITLYFYLRQPENGVSDKAASRSAVSQEETARSDTRPSPPAPQPAAVPTEKAAPPPVPSDAAPEANVKAPPAVVTPVPAVPKKGTHQIMVSATAWTWLKMVIDKDPPFEVLLKPGESLMRSDFQKVTMTIGDAAGVAVTFDGKKIQIPGSSGDTVVVTLPKAVKAIKKRKR